MYRLAILLLVGTAAAQFQCPPDDGFYVDPRQCDKYYDCYRGTQTEKLCPDGLIFDTTQGPRVEQCNYPFIVECPEGSSLQTPQPSGIECPRQNGYFEHENAKNCESYYECTNGLAVLRKCATGLVFDEFTGVCQWSHTGVRSGCGFVPEVLADGFSCPNNTQLHTNGQELDHARYVNPNDCRFFYVCEDGIHPREVGCPKGTVFNDVNLLCDAPENVPGCENYYPAEDVRSAKAGGLI
uniref:Gastrolith protein 30 n=1 Tax=Cherax quadricarinatus TaxID=27406 RepID=U5XK53_CHEQU|nr:gastrolith protein 30 [Cherax quadricarinatus]AVD68954.1 obstructor A [Cherax quadricarinatus]